MKHKSLLRNCFDILVFVLFFFAIQAIVPFIAGGVYGYVHKESVAEDFPFSPRCLPVLK